jgi:hypothetical protein
VVLHDRCCGSCASGIGDDQLIAYPATILDEVAQSFEDPAEGAHMSPDNVVRPRSPPGADQVKARGGARYISRLLAGLYRTLVPPSEIAEASD